MQISVFPNANTPNIVTNYDIETVFEWIKTGKFRDSISEIRIKQAALSQIEKGTQEYIRIDTEKSKAKKQLCSIVFQGVFTYRSMNSLTVHSELATLDFDHVKDPAFMRDHIFNNYNFVYSAFISPSGDGVKILVRIPKVANDKEYKEYYIVLLNYFDDATRDESTKDISRICFISHDPDIKVRDWEQTGTFTERHDSSKQPEPIIESIPIRNRDKAFDTAKRMIRESDSGNMHFTLLKASRLLGGYVAGGSIFLDDAIQLLENEIRTKPIRSFTDAQKTIQSGVKYGQMSPIRNEQQETKRYELKQNNTFDDDTATIRKIEHGKIKFPYEIFPAQLQTLITELTNCLNFPADFTATGILSVFSAILRNSIKVEVIPGYIDSGCLWIMQIGDPGSSKSHPIKKMYAPLMDYEGRLIHNFKLQFAEYTSELAAGREGKKPKQKELIVNDFTIESLFKTLDYNSSGVGLFIDELKTWIDGMGKYSGGKSNDIQIWLSIWSHLSIKMMRKTQDIPSWIELPFVSVIGTIQPEELMDINRRYYNNGFFDRFLFCFPSVGMEKKTRKELDIEILKQYNTNIISILGEYEKLIDDSLLFSQVTILKFTQEAQMIYYKADDWLVDVANSEMTNAALKSYISKLRTYLPRLALVIQVINSAFDGYVPVDIEERSIVSARKLIKYFYMNAEIVYSKFNESTDVTETMDHNRGKSKQDKIYALHLSGINSKDIAKRMKIAESTVRVAINRAKKSSENQ